ncbi:unnamed protein product, partial [Laminaria digitata]
GNKTARGKKLGLSRSLAWIQEKNFEDKFEVVKVIGQGSIGEVSIVRKKSLSTSQHGHSSNNLSRDSTFVELHDVAVVGGKERASSVDSSRGERGGVMSIPSPLRGSPLQDRLYAMKSIHVNRLSKSRVEEFENEVNILQRLHHPNIIQLREVFYYKKKIYMCMTLCNGEGVGCFSSSYTLLKPARLNHERQSPPASLDAPCMSTGGQLNERCFDESEVCSIMSQVVRALVYMHETAMICHRDLKMENIMLESKDGPLVVKLIDFGLSKVFTEGDKMRTACGTVYTMAPEVLSGAGYTQKADLWSAGVIAFMLLCGSFPFLKDEADLNDKDKVEQLAQARYLFTDTSWKRVSAGGKGFVRGMLKKQPGYRWTAREALDHCADVWG